MIHYIVTGAPRTGTSMMMRCLELGGIPAAADKTDPEFGQGTQLNKYGCYEIGRAGTKTRQYTLKQMFRDFPEMCIKIDIDRIMHIPTDITYDVIFMLRSAKSVHASMMYQSNVSLKRGLIERAEREERGAKRYKTKELYHQLIGGRIQRLSELSNVRLHLINYDKILQQPVPEFMKLHQAGWPIDFLKAAGGVEIEERRF